MPAINTHSLLELQSEILKLVALGEDLVLVADTLCRRAEILVGDVVCSILTVDREGLLHPLAGPSLPHHYSAALDGYPIGPEVGSCGTAAFRRQEVVVTDIATDPLWDVPRALALPLGLRACWSSPIMADDGRAVATFAFYYRTCRGPNQTERRIVKTCVDLCAIAIRHSETQAHITRLAYMDALTGLPNRASFERFVAGVLSRTGSRTLGIHYLDLDDFKTINDTLGHRTGDLLLAEVGKRLKKAVGESAFVARLGGDEFAICCENFEPEDQERVARAALASLASPVVIAEHHLRVGASIGIALAPEHGRDLEQLTRNADMALYKAKAASRNTHRVFSPEMGVEIRERGALKNDLRLAISNGEFHIVYQPIVDMRTRVVRSFEALLRWTHPTRGPVRPDHFIPMAEEMGLIGEIGGWVLRRATMDATSWPAEIGVAVNVSPLQLECPNFALDVAEALGESGLPPARLNIEITETVLFERGGATKRTLEGLKTLGIGIALDDFGTGYSSLSLLRERQFTKLKIDKSFVGGLGSDPDCDAIVESTIDVARKMGFRTTAEGVETPSQLMWLKERGCDEGQGYLLSRPILAQAIAGFLEGGTWDVLRPCAGPQPGACETRSQGPGRPTDSTVSDAWCAAVSRPRLVYSDACTSDCLRHPDNARPPASTTPRVFNGVAEAFARPAG